jgi:hypothetical protein
MDIVSETPLTPSEDGMCLWCDRLFQARRTGGTPKKFCSPAHRNAFHTAARKWAEKAVADGRITLDDLKRDPAACTLLPAASSLSPACALAGRSASGASGTRPPSKKPRAKSSLKFAPQILQKILRKI